MRTMSAILREIVSDRRGVSSTELGIVLGLVALGSVQAMSSLGQEVEEDLDLAKTEVAANRSNADPFAPGPDGARVTGGDSINGSIGTSGGGGVPEPAAASDAGAGGGVPEPAAASVAPDPYDWSAPGPGGGGAEPPTSTRTVGPEI